MKTYHISGTLHRQISYEFEYQVAHEDLKASSEQDAIARIEARPGGWKFQLPPYVWPVADQPQPAQPALFALEDLQL